MALCDNHRACRGKSCCSFWALEVSQEWKNSPGCWECLCALPLGEFSAGTQSSCRVLARAVEQHKGHIENGCAGEALLPCLPSKCSSFSMKSPDISSWKNPSACVMEKKLRHLLGLGLNDWTVGETSLEMLFLLPFPEGCNPSPLGVLQGRTLRKELQLAVVNSEQPACRFYRTEYDDTFLYHQEIPCVEANLQIVAVCFMEKIYLCILFSFHNFKLVSFSSFLAPFLCCHLLFTPLPSPRASHKNEREICV